MILVLILIFGISASFAADVNQTDEIQKINDDTDILVSVSDADTISSIETNDSDDSILLESASKEKLSASSNSKTDSTQSDDDESILNQNNRLDDTESILKISSDDILGDEEYRDLSELGTLIKITPDMLIVDQDYIFSGTTLTITKSNYVIDFNGHTISGNSANNIVLKITASDVTIKNLKFINSASTNGQGAISVVGNNIVFDNIYTENIQDGIISVSGSRNLLIKNSNFNHKRNAIRTTNCQIINSNFSGSANNIYGINPIGPNVDVINCSFYQSRATISQEGLNVLNCNFSKTGNPLFISSMATVSNCIFTDCTSLTGDGQVSITGGYSGLAGTIIKDCKFIRCTSTQMIIRAHSQVLTVTQCEFINCTSTDILIQNVQKISNCIFTGNKFNRLTSYDSAPVIENCIFIGNTATSGNIIKGSTSVIVRNSSFYNNTAASGIIRGTTASSKIRVYDSYFATQNEFDGWAITVTNGDSSSKIYVDDETTFNNITKLAIVPTIFDNTLKTHLYVNQTGGGDGSLENPMSISEALSNIEPQGTITFINNGEVYNFKDQFVSTFGITFEGNGVTVNNQFSGSAFKTNTAYEDVTFKNFNFVECGGSSANAVLYIMYGVRFNVLNCNFTNNKGISSGGIGFIGDNHAMSTKFIVISNCNFINNTATGSESTTERYNGKLGAGAILSRGAGTNITHCTFINNSGLYVGGVLLAPYAGNGYVEYCNFIGNTATTLNAATGTERFAEIEYSNAGALAFIVALSSSHIIGCNFTKNSCPIAGAVQCVANDIIDCNFNENNATNMYGTLFLSKNVEYNINNCNFSGNNVKNSDGGAIYLKTGSAVTVNCNFNNNYASGKGSAIYSVTPMSINNCNFNQNRAGNNIGGAVYNVFDISNSNFDGNINGGVVVDTASAQTLTITDSSFKNHVGTSGSAIYSVVLTKISNTKFDNNKASTDSAVYLNYEGNEILYSNFTNNKGVTGAALYIVGDNNIIDECIFKNNFANSTTLGGGALYASGNYTLIMNSAFTGNNATYHGGAIYICPGLYYSVDQNTMATFKGTNKCFNIAGMPSTKNWHDIYDEDALELLLNVYVVKNPDSIPGNVKSGSDRQNPCDFETALSVVAPLGSIIFINNGEIFNSTTTGTSYANLPAVDFNKNGVKLFGNDTIFMYIQFHISSHADDVEIHDITFKEAKEHALSWEGLNGVIDACSFIDNGGEDSAFGPAVNVHADGLTITNSKFINNTVGDYETSVGGCIFVNASDLKISGSSFDGNIANYGADLYVNEGVTGVEIADSNFKNAKQLDNGGVALLFKNEENVNIHGNNFTDNTYGGAIRAESGIFGLNIKNNKFKNNKASNGGAINIAVSVNTAIEGNTFESNTATSNGGALYVASGEANSKSNVFTGNRANLGGAIYTGARLSVSDSNFTSNSAVNGGAIYSTAALTVSGSKFTSNSATGTSGAIYMTASGSSIQDSTFSGNTANSYRNVYSTSVPTFAGNTIDASYTLNSISDATYPADVTITGTFEDGNNFASDVRITANGNEATTFSLTNSNSFSASWEDVIPGTYNVVVANTDVNNNKFVYTTTPARSFSVSRRNVIYVGNTAGSTGYGLTADDPTTWDHVAELLAEGGTVYFTSGTYSDFYGKTVGNSWTLSAVDGATVVLDANNNGRIFTVSANNVQINGLTFKNGKVSNNQGSAIYWTGTGGSITNSVFTENTGTPISSSSTISISNSQMKNQITLSKSNINWGTTETITGTFAHNAPSTVNILFNGTSQGSYSVASGKVTFHQSFN